MKLTIVIPALNEEEGIASIIERTLAARETIIQRSPVDEVEIIVVSDGSTDRTADIAAGFEGIRVIVFEKNRGYGAAIKKGFEEGTGELVSFLDADGTCDPTFFCVLCRALFEENAAVALGARLGPESCMPPVRRWGNRMYALVLSLLSNRVITDTASGMRVIRRDALPQLYPLPDGLHFTPAMSARVLMDDHMKMIERPMPYEERIGESKLHVVRDGLRFFRTIFEMTLMWRPAKLLIASAALCLMIMTLLAMHPIEMWLRVGRLQEDMIFRLLFCSFLGSVGLTLLSAGVVCEHFRRMIDHRQRDTTFIWSLLDRCFSFRFLVGASVATLPALAWLVGPGGWTWVTAGFVEVHWSRVVLAGLIGFGLCQLIVTTLTVNLFRFHTARKTQSVRGRASLPVSADTRTTQRTISTPSKRTLQLEAVEAPLVMGEPGAPNPQIEPAN